MMMYTVRDIVFNRMMMYIVRDIVVKTMMMYTVRDIALSMYRLLRTYLMGIYNCKTL